MSQIRTEPTASALWQQLVRDAEESVPCRLDEELESYLVFVLMRHTRNAAIGHRAMALDYLDAMNTAGTRRLEDMREVGDGCLLVAGLFPLHARRRLVPVSYFVDLGRSAYDDLSGRLRDAYARMYRDLAQAFVRLVDVLLAIRRRGKMPPRLLEPLAAFDLWERCGSLEAKRALGLGALTPPPPQTPFQRH